METTNIYVLIDPRTNEVRYVGKANNVSQRYRAHLNRARKHQTHKRNWLEQLKREGFKPIMEVIDVVPIDSWQYWEIYWISQMKQWGFKLVNYTNGGDGCTFANQTSFKKGQGGKRVVGYDRNCIKKYEFDTAENATKHFKVHRSSIPRCANGNSKTIKNYAWFYVENIKGLDKVQLKEEINKRFLKDRKPNSGSFKKGQKGRQSKLVLMYDLDWKFIKEFESAKLAGEFIGVTGGAIQFACLKSKKSQCRNNKFKYKNYE